MNVKEWKKQWLQEEQRVFKGWDFSSLDGRMAGDGPPWSYEAAVRQYINDKTTLLDMQFPQSQSLSLGTIFFNS